MKGLKILLCVVVALAAAGADAGPLRRRSTATVAPFVSGDTSTAQGVAEIQARRCVMGHCGGNAGFEGVGVGSTPQAALNACCNNGQTVVDQGGPDGRYYACKRYAR